MLFLFLLFFAASASRACLIQTTTFPPAHYPPLPPDPLCAYTSSPLAAPLSWDDADSACIESFYRPLACGEVVPLFSTSYGQLAQTCAPLRACTSQWLITPSFRFMTLQNPLGPADVVSSEYYWTYLNAQGQVTPFGVGVASAPHLLSNTIAPSSATLPVVCLCVNVTAPTAAPTTSAPTLHPSRSPTVAPFLPSNSPTRSPVIV